MKKKNIVLAILLALVAVVLFGCGEKEQSADGLDGEITFCTWGSEQEIDMDQELCDLFMEQHPGTKVNLEVINADYTTTIETRFLGGQAPDVIYGHPRTFLPWVQSGMLMDLSDLYEKHTEWWDESVWNTNLYKPFNIDGKYYGVVNGADVFVLYYNKTMSDEHNAGYPDSSWSWDQLMEWGQKLTTRNPDDTPKSYGLYIDENSYYGLLAYIYANGGSVFDDVDNPTKVTFYSDETLEVLQRFHDKIYKYKCVPQGDDWSYITGGFVSNEIASYVSGVYDTVFLSGIEDFDWDMTLLPQKENSRNVALYAGYAVCADTKNPELAKAFVEFMMTDEAQKILGKTGLITVANKQVASSDEVLNFPGAPEHNYLRYEALENAVNMDPMLNSWVQMIYEVIQDNVYKLSVDEIGVEECAQNIQKGLEKLLAEELASRNN